METSQVEELRSRVKRLIEMGFEVRGFAALCQTTHVTVYAFLNGRPMRDSTVEAFARGLRALAYAAAPEEYSSGYSGLSEFLSDHGLRASLAAAYRCSLVISSLLCARLRRAPVPGATR